MKKKFFTKEEEIQILEAIKNAEKNTSGEIRVHIDFNTYSDTMKRAREIFVKLNMRKTKLKNGVLFYLSINDKKFAIIGDNEINKKVPDDFWESTKNIVIEHFKKGEFVTGIDEGIKKAGEQLSIFFPYQKDDINELPDSISYEVTGDSNEK
jgi:uncharacterized membrane protein